MFSRWRRPNPSTHAPVDHAPAAAAYAAAEQAHVVAERQAHEARVEVAELHTVQIRNGFAPAIEDSILRRLQGRTA